MCENVFDEIIFDSDSELKCINLNEVLDQTLCHSILNENQIIYTEDEHSDSLSANVNCKVETSDSLYKTMGFNFPYVFNPGKSPSIQPWEGTYDFSAAIPTESTTSKEWCYSSKLDRLYTHRNVFFPVAVKVNCWQPNMALAVMAVFHDLHHRTACVMRCYTCQTKYHDMHNVAPEHILVSDEPCAEYSCTEDGHFIMRLPITPPSVGEDCSTFLIQTRCLTSCIGGPNRRPFVIVFTLLSNNEEKGRAVINMKACQCPRRDMTNDEGVPKPAKTIESKEPYYEAKYYKKVKKYLKTLRVMDHAKFCPTCFINATETSEESSQ